ncbi:MAG: ABC transporter substrate-binding protein [Chloroflexota bacterium]|nr:ABC transporter substrate-binding protein [Chloroflexota bacterium]
MKRSAIVSLLLGVLIALAACTPSPTGPGTITDDVGRTVDIEAVPEHIVSLAPAITEILFALGLGDCVVGVTDHCDYPGEATGKPRVGGYFTTNLETILSQDPDLVLADGHDPVCAQLEDAGATMVVLQPEDIDGILDDIELVGEITAMEEEAATLVADMQGRMDAVAGIAAGADKPTAFYVIDASDPTKPWTAGAGSFVDALIYMAGGENIAHASAEWAQFNLEVLVGTDPDVVIVDASHGEALVPDFSTLTGWKELSAVKNGNVYLIDGNLMSRPGPRIVEGLEELASIIHPELFPQQ